MIKQGIAFLLAISWQLLSMVQAADCREDFYTYDPDAGGGNGGGRPYVASYTDVGSADTCEHQVSMPFQEYQILKAKAEGFSELDNVVGTLNDLFEFSVEDFALFNAICLIGFITGHSIGRVLRLLGKT